MKNNLPQRGSRYFIAIIPPSPILEEVQELKNYFKNKYESRAALNSPPHITLHMPFFWKAEEEDLLISLLTEFAKSRESMTIELSNFSSFALRVIFIGVTENERLSKLHHELNRFCKSKLSLFNAEYKDLPFHPHLTLAFRDLKKKKFLLAWEEFGKRTLSASFTIDKISLLKHNNKTWEPYQHFHF